MLIERLEILLLADLEEYLHGVAVVIDFGEAAEVALHLVPIPVDHLVLEVLHVEVESRLLLKLVDGLLELLLIEELQDEEDELPAERRHPPSRRRRQMRLGS